MSGFSRLGGLAARATKHPNVQRVPMLGYRDVPTPGIFQKEGDCDQLALRAMFQYHRFDANPQHIAQLSALRGRYFCISSDLPEASTCVAEAKHLFEALKLIALPPSAHPESLLRTLDRFGPFVNYYQGHATLIVAVSIPLAIPLSLAITI